MKYYSEKDYLNEVNKKEEIIADFGCGFCWDKKKNKNKELFFLDSANNMRVCFFCPSCGRKFSEV